MGFSRAARDPGHKQRVVYALTEKAIDLVPLMAVMGSWGMRHTLPSTDLLIGAQVLEDGGPQLWSEFMEELRHLHLGAPRPEASVFAKFETAYEASLSSS